MTKPNGISVLIATQNAIQTIRLAVLSNLVLCDELICVDNRSIDGTVECLEQLAREHQKVTFINAPHHIDNYQNWQLALEHSRYRWITRCGADYIAFTSGERDIRGLRDIVLGTEPTKQPTAFEFNGVWVIGDWYHTKKGFQVAGIGRLVHQYVEGMKFCRMGRLEGVGLPKGMKWKRVRPKTIYWMHASISAPKDRFIRIYRTEWRELGDFVTWPDAESYARHKRPEMFEGDAIERWAKRQISALAPYTGEHPEIVLRHLERSQ